jgi:asparagine synthase (glutamine-hydrolysing)
MPFDPPFEKRYPFLDRGLLEFMFAIPREQSVRPTQRRSLMRRALVGIVPPEILNRKRKAFVVRAPLIGISRDWSSLVEMIQHLPSGSLGIVHAERVSDALQKARRGEDVNMIHLTRTIGVETWLRQFRTLRIALLETNPKRELEWKAAIYS